MTIIMLLLDSQYFINIINIILTEINIILTEILYKLFVDYTKIIGALGQYFRTSLIHLEATL